MSIRILVRGSNDISSAVAHTLFSAGFSAAIHDIPKPTVTRRKMAFTDAIFNGNTKLEGVRAFLVNRSFLLRGMLAHHQVIPVSIGKFDEIIKIIRPHILVDARMYKHKQPARQLGLAPLTLGLGPNFVAGDTTDLVVETFGNHLGKVLEHGAPLPLQGEPTSIAGHARDRYVYAPCDGTFSTLLQPGDSVSQGQFVARINQAALYAPLTGILRGITHDDVVVKVKTKVIEVDPRGAAAEFATIADRPACIANGVLQAIQIWEKKHYAD